MTWVTQGHVLTTATDRLEPVPVTDYRPVTTACQGSTTTPLCSLSDQ
jgi:hypothetical protein